MVNERFMRTSLLLGEEGIEKLRRSTVMIIGLGAVGGYALEAVARSGVGNLILVDFDCFDLTNINRQILALSSTIGRKKTEVAKERVKEINPDCNVTIYDMFVNEETLPQLLSHHVDYVIDAIDSLTSKCQLMTKLYFAEIPFISSMGAALKTDPSCIRTGILSKTQNCSLSKLIRNRLRKQGVDLNKVHCVYSNELAQKPCVSEESEKQESNETKRKPLGSLPTITAIFGLTLANYVIKELSASEK